MKRIIQFIVQLTTAILFLLFIEGIASMADEFDCFAFEKYTIVAWIAQSCAVLFTIAISFFDWWDKDGFNTLF